MEVVGETAGYSHRRGTTDVLPSFLPPSLSFPPVQLAVRGGNHPPADRTKPKKGTSDNFYKQGQLLPENFVEAAEGKGKVNVRWQDGYDHSYFTMATFADDHVGHAARYLLA